MATDWHPDQLELQLYVDRKSGRDCWNCRHSGYDPDGPYCVNPKVLEEHRYGLVLSSGKLAEICPYPAHPLFEKKGAPRNEP